MAQIGDVTRLLHACPAYTSTPLTDAPALAHAHSVERLFLKDETERMGLGSFKALGGAYAVLDIARARMEDLHGASLPVDASFLDALKSIETKTTYCCASAGNHGLSVLAGANLINARAVIFLAESVPEAFAQRLRAKGAEVRRAGASYDDSMAAAREACEQHGWVLVSDSSWPGYQETPLSVMKGYGVISDEVASELSGKQTWPTHVFLQAGVGGLAAALANHMRLTWPVQPAIIVVEPENAACLMESMRVGAVTRISAPGTTMGRLDCAEPSLVAFDILKETADAFMTVRDSEAQAAARQLADHGLQTTPSGAAGYAGLAALAADDKARSAIGLDDNAQSLCVVTETALDQGAAGSA
ncbi:MAG: diaminopropionate ammonia-lyase [Hyphococcus sp.]